MKKMIFVSLLILSSIIVNAQLKNTKWKGTITTDTEMEVVFHYKSDTLEVLNSSDGSVMETLTYSIIDSTISFQKIYGQSDCDGSSTGLYTFIIKDEILHISLVSDICGIRSSVMNNSKWTKIQ